MKTLADEIAEENDRLSFKMRNNSIKNRVLTAEQVRELHIQRDEELKRLESRKSKSTPMYDETM